MVLLEQLKARAIAKGLMSPRDELDVERAFLLVRDMPYARASSRAPGTIIEEWRGTCSGKHYLLKGLFGELGYSSRLIVCTTVADLVLSLIHISEPTRPFTLSRMPSSA